MSEWESLDFKSHGFIKKLKTLAAGLQTIAQRLEGEEVKRLQALLRLAEQSSDAQVVYYNREIRERWGNRRKLKKGR